MGMDHFGLASVMLRHQGLHGAPFVAKFRLACLCYINAITSFA